MHNHPPARPLRCPHCSGVLEAEMEDQGGYYSHKVWVGTVCGDCCAAWDRGGDQVRPPILRAATSTRVGVPG